MSGVKGTVELWSVAWKCCRSVMVVKDWNGQAEVEAVASMGGGLGGAEKVVAWESSPGMTVEVLW